MGIFINNKRVKNVYINNKECKQVYINNNPVWIYRFVSEDTNKWSTCSKTCGGGTQTWKFTCYRFDDTNRNNQIVKPATYCSGAGTYKSNGSTSVNMGSASYTDKNNVRTYTQSCNTNSCTFKLRLYGATDDKIDLFYKLKPSGSYTKIVSEGDFGSIKHSEYTNYDVDIDLANKTPTDNLLYFKLHHWDTNGTHSGLRLALINRTNNNQCRTDGSFFVNTGYHSADYFGYSYVWFTLNIETMAMKIVKATNDSTTYSFVSTGDGGDTVGYEDPINPICSEIKTGKGVSTLTGWNQYCAAERDCANGVTAASKCKQKFGDRWYIAYYNCIKAEPTAWS